MIDWLWETLGLGVAVVLTMAAVIMVAMALFVICSSSTVFLLVLAVLLLVLAAGLSARGIGWLYKWCQKPPFTTEEARTLMQEEIDARKLQDEITDEKARAIVQEALDARQRQDALGRPMPLRLNPTDWQANN